MQSSSVQVGFAREAITDYLPCRLDFDTALGQQNECSRNHKPQEPRTPVRRIGLAIQHMIQHLNEPLRISTLAAMTQLSPSHFFSLFKLATGFTPIAFFIGLRMQRACELLQNPQSTIKETAEAVGYSDRYYFTRMFKQVIGIPPGKYRKELLTSSAKTPDGAPSNAALENRGLPSMTFAFSTMKDLGIVTAPELRGVRVGVR